jgi:hypothetical protein
MAHEWHGTNGTTQSKAWHAANKREQELYRRCYANPIGANWKEYFDARRNADALRFAG